MATEKELKFLVISDEWKTSVSRSMHIVQGFLGSKTDRSVVVRIRIIDATEALLTVKGPSTVGPDGIPEKPEFEWPIPLDEANAMMSFAAGVIRKTRHNVNLGDYLWEIDEFEGALSGLTLAELEERPGQKFPPQVLPGFVGKDVSNDMAYSNVAMGYNGLPEAVI